MTATGPHNDELETFTVVAVDGSGRTTHGMKAHDDTPHVGDRIVIEDLPGRTRLILEADALADFGVSWATLAQEQQRS